MLVRRFSRSLDLTAGVLEKCWCFVVGVHVASFDRLVLDVVTQDLDKRLQILCCPCGEAQNSGCCDGSDLGFGCLGGVGGGSFLDGIGMKWTSAIVGVGFGAGAVLRTVVVASLYCDEPELIAVILVLEHVLGCRRSAHFIEGVELCCWC